jgi:hypothetical protein
MLKNALVSFVYLVLSLTFLCACQAPRDVSDERLTTDVPIQTTNDTYGESAQTTQEVQLSPNDTENIEEMEFSDWKTACLYFIESNKEFNKFFALAYVDGDDIPELYVVGCCEAEGDSICAYKNGYLHELKLNRVGGGKYIEKSGNIFNNNGHMGRYYIDVSKLDENGFTHTFDATRTESYVHIGKDNYDIICEYFIGKETVSEEEYNAAVSASFDTSQAIDFYENKVAYDVIIRQIDDHE